MSEPILLSILTPTIPSRFEKMKALSDSIQAQIGELPVEHLVFSDNKKRSIGMKREALMQIANGSYISFCDDDDFVHPIYCAELVAAIRSNPEVDVVSFDQNAVLDGKKFTVSFGLGNKNEQAQIGPDDQFYNIQRQPFHVCAWRASLAKKYHFENTGENEDWLWVQQLLAEAKTEIHIPKILHTYRYDSNLSEGDQTIQARAAKAKEALDEILPA